MKPNFGIQMMVVFASIIAVLATIGAGAYYGNYLHSTTPAPSYQAQNLEVLKSAQPNDLAVCVIKKGDGATTVVRAILVDQNYGNRILGRELNKNTVLFSAAYTMESFNDCEVELQRDMPTSDMPAHLGRIILYGLNDPQHPIR